MRKKRKKGDRFIFKNKSVPFYRPLLSSPFIVPFYRPLLSSPFIVPFYRSHGLCGNAYRDALRHEYLTWSVGTIIFTCAPSMVKSLFYYHEGREDHKGKKKRFLNLVFLLKTPIIALYLVEKIGQ